MTKPKEKFDVLCWVIRIVYIAIMSFIFYKLHSYMALAPAIIFAGVGLAALWSWTKIIKDNNWKMVLSTMVIIFCVYFCSNCISDNRHVIMLDQNNRVVQQYDKESIYDDGFLPPPGVVHLWTLITHKFSTDGVPQKGKIKHYAENGDIIEIKYSIRDYNELYNSTNNISNLQDFESEINRQMNESPDNKPIISGVEFS